MKRNIFLAILVFLVSISLLSAKEMQLSVNEIVKNANKVAYYQGKDGRARVSMTITDSQDRKRFRQFTILRLNIGERCCGEQKYYVYFHRPADVNKMVFMV